ncbi:hypothetical protein [Yoonia sp.]|uniref:hypothetical protein n=1 Tax=Yoonia sp. TaxID=2212373 RepID=UPI00397480EC
MKRIAMVFTLAGLAGCGADGAPFMPRANVGPSGGTSEVSTGASVGASNGTVSVGVGI